MASPASSNDQGFRQSQRRPLAEACVAFAVFCAVSVLSRFVGLLFVVLVLGGIAFPLAWAGLTRDWAAVGLRRRDLGRAVRWGVAAGLLLVAVIWFTTEHKASPLLLVQLAVGVPIWMLIMSPFQELFFRGWLQPRFQAGLGRWPGLAVASVCFALWHLCPPFEQAQIVPVASIQGMLFTMGMGLLFGYIFQRTGNIVAPWLAHVLAGTTLIFTGAMTFVQYVE
jgi:membrane protease YdiL (CAAX protease family)